MTLLEGRPDLYPENMIGRGYYRDTGCPASPSCLKCPLPACVEDKPSNSELVGTRNARIRVLRIQGRSIRSLQVKFNLSTRSVHRIVHGVGS